MQGTSNSNRHGNSSVSFESELALTLESAFIVLVLMGVIIVLQVFAGTLYFENAFDGRGSTSFVTMQMWKTRRRFLERFVH